MTTQSNPVDQFGIQRGLVYKSIQQLQQTIGSKVSPTPTTQSRQSFPHHQTQVTSTASQTSPTECSPPFSLTPNKPQQRFGQLSSTDSHDKSTELSSEKKVRSNRRTHVATSSETNGQLSSPSLSQQDNYQNELNLELKSQTTKKSAEEVGTSVTSLATHNSCSAQPLIFNGQPFDLQSNNLNGNNGSSSLSSFSSSEGTKHESCLAIKIDGKSNGDSVQTSTNGLQHSLEEEKTSNCSEEGELPSGHLQTLKSSAESSLSASLDSELDSAIHSSSQPISSQSSNGVLITSRLPQANDEAWLMKRRPLVVDADLEMQLAQVNRLLENTENLKLSEDTDSLMDLLDTQSVDDDDSEPDERSSVFDAPEEESNKRSVEIQRDCTSAQQTKLSSELDSNECGSPSYPVCSNDEIDRSVPTSDQLNNVRPSQQIYSQQQTELIEIDPTRNYSPTDCLNSPESNQSPVNGELDSSDDLSAENNDHSEEDANEPSSIKKSVRQLNGVQNSMTRFRSKSNLKQSGSDRERKRRVSFDPLALLLDAALEGELELVKKTAAQVSARNNLIIFIKFLLLLS